MTITVDFDGVLHTYSRGWHDGTIYDPPMPGAFNALHLLQTVQPVVILSTRDPEQIHTWMRYHSVLKTTTNDECPHVTRDLSGWNATCTRDCTICSGTTRRTFWDDRNVILITQRKIPATAYIDDRAVRFTNWADTLNAVFLPDTP